MKRRTFIQFSAVGSAAVLITGINCKLPHPAFIDILDKPEQLSHICDLETIREIGRAYRLQTPTDSEAGRLTEILLADTAGKPVSSNSDDLFIQALMNQKIEHDFETGNTVMVKGWILAVTEARQCALLFVNSQ